MEMTTDEKRVLQAHTEHPKSRMKHRNKKHQIRLWREFGFLRPWHPDAAATRWKDVPFAFEITPQGRAALAASK